MMMIVLQFRSSKSLGPARSFICALAELPELRLTANALPKCLTGAGREDAGPGQIDDRLAEFVEPEVGVDRGRRGWCRRRQRIEHRADQDVLTFASAKPASVRLTDGPQQGGLLLPTSHVPDVTYVRTVITGSSAEPPSKS